MDMQKGVKFDSKLTFEGHVLGIVSRVSQSIGILRWVRRVFVDTTVLLHCYYTIHCYYGKYQSKPILEYCSSVWGSAAECLPLLERQVYLVAGLCPDQSIMLLCRQHHVDGLRMLYKVNSNSNHCLFSELSPVTYSSV